MVKVLILSFCMFLPFQVNASPLNEFYTTQALERYFVLPEDARAVATAGSTIPFCEGSVCLYQNPAGLGFQDNWEFSSTLEQRELSGNEFLTEKKITQEEDRGFGLLSLPLRFRSTNYGTLALGYSRYHGSTNDSISTTPDGHRRSFAYGYALNNNSSLGYSFTFYDDQLQSEFADLHSHARFLHLFGIQLKVTQQVMLGIIARLGIGQSDTADFRQQSDGLSYPRERGAIIGVSYRNDRVKGFLTGHYSRLTSRGNLTDISSPSVVIGEDEEGEVCGVGMGLEVAPFPHLTARAGVAYEHTDYTFSRPDLLRLSGRFHAVIWGTGIGYEPFLSGSFRPRIEYGVRHSSVGNEFWTHTISLILNLPF